MTREAEQTTSTELQRDTMGGYTGTEQEQQQLARLSLGIRFEGKVHVMGTPWRVATFIIDAPGTIQTHTHKHAQIVAQLVETANRHTPLRSQTDHETGLHQD